MHPKTNRILVVDDDAATRVLVRRYLERLGYAVLLAESGPKALRLFEEHHRTIKLVVTDIVMPEMDGLALVRRLRQLQPNVKVLLISGYADDIIAEHGAMPPETAFLAKPFMADGLGAKVEAVLRKPS